MYSRQKSAVFFMRNWRVQKYENWLFKKYQMSV